MGVPLSKRKAAGSCERSVSAARKPSTRIEAPPLGVVLQAMQQLVVRRPLPIGQIGVAKQPERRISVAVGLLLREHIEMFAEIGRPCRADQTREGENAQWLARRVAQDGNAEIAQQTEPVQQRVVAACNRVVVRSRHRLRELCAPCSGRRAATRLIGGPAAMPSQPVRVVVADMAFGLPLDPEAARVGNRDRPGLKVGRHGERIEDSFQSVRMPAFRTTTVVPATKGNGMSRRCRRPR